MSKEDGHAIMIHSMGTRLFLNAWRRMADQKYNSPEFIVYRMADWPGRELPLVQACVTERIGKGGEAMITESHNSYMPKYVQIQNYVLQKIQEGVFSEGDKIPSEAELSRQFAVSRITVNTAIKDLASRGVVERIQGKGTFICAVAQDRKQKSMAFAGGIKLPSYEMSVQKPHKLVKHGVIQAGPLLCRKLGLEDLFIWDTFIHMGEQILGLTTTICVS